jgi:hypothetical protein
MAILDWIYKPWFTLRRTTMNKASVRIKKQQLVMDVDDAVMLFKLLSKMGVEHMDYDYVKGDSEKGTSSKSVYYVEPVKDLVELTSVNDEDYAMMKLYASTREHE